MRTALAYVLAATGLDALPIDKNSLCEIAPTAFSLKESAQNSFGEIPK